MRYSTLFPNTLKEAPGEEVALNAKLLLRGGFIDKLMAGSYTLLPLGRIIERKIEKIIKEEMDATGAQEILMPLLHPKSVWNETGRWDSASEVMYQFQKDEKEYALSFTHEEILLDIVRKHAITYKDFPIKLYHFSTKFRSELRAKSGILRGREFLMKDLYSLHTSKEDLDNYYWQVKDAYLKVFARLNLKAVIAEAGGGVFTDSNTHEFQILSESGEDTIYFKEGWEYWKNKEILSNDELSDPSLVLKQAIEVGNIFRFGTFYCEKMSVFFVDEKGERKHPWFGSYGIGVTRLIGVLAEVNNDEKGLIWPESVAPFRVYLISIGRDEEAQRLYNELTDNRVEVLFDDRADKSVGEKFADCDLLGIPIRLVVSNRNEGQFELKKRQKNDVEIVPQDKLKELIMS